MQNQHTQFIAQCSPISLRVPPRRLRRDRDVPQKPPPATTSLLVPAGGERRHVRRPLRPPARLIHPRDLRITYQAHRDVSSRNSSRSLRCAKKSFQRSQGHSHLSLTVQHHSYCVSRFVARAVSLWAVSILPFPPRC